LNKEITVLIPAYNEANRIKDTILAVQEVRKVGEIIVINDGSTDRTAEIARETGVELINLETNQGKGSALNVGLKQSSGNIIALLDADLGGTASELKKLLIPVLQGKVDMTIARFPPPKQKGGFGLVTNLARLGLKLFTGYFFESPLCGQRVLKREVVEYLEGFSSGFGVEVAMTIDVIKGGFKVEEVPVEMSHRETRRDWTGFRHRGQQFKDVLIVFWNQVRGVIR
jgi:glycosyltransferase involved in cell wall biosynthesis